MHGVAIFFNVKQHQPNGFFSNASDLCFSPINYLFQGRTIVFYPTIQDYASFGGSHPNSIPYSRCRTVAALILFLPGGILGILFKGVDLCYSKSRYFFTVTYRHFNPLPFTIGSENFPVKDLKFILNGLEGIKDCMRDGRRVSTLTLYFQSIDPNEFLLNEDLVTLAPDKLILIGKGKLDETLVADFSKKLQESQHKTVLFKQFTKTAAAAEKCVKEDQKTSIFLIDPSPKNQATTDLYE